MYRLIFVKFPKSPVKRSVCTLLKLRHCEKATKFEKISHLFWHPLSNVKTSGRSFQIFVAFSENLNFMVPEVIISKLNQYQKFAFYAHTLLKSFFSSAMQCSVHRDAFWPFLSMQFYGSYDFQMWVNFESNFLFPSHLGREIKIAFEIFLPFQHDW